MIFHYWTVRFVPDSARSEHTNIGLVVGGDDGEWAARFDPRFVRNHGELSSDLRELAAWGRSFDRLARLHASPELDGDRSLSSGLIEHMRRRQSTLIQLAPPLPVEASSAAAAVELLHPVLVEREPARRRSSYSRRTLRARVRDVLMAEDGFVRGRDLFVTPKFSVGRQSGEFDVLRLDRHREVVTNVWAFNVVSLSPLIRDLQSWSYLVGLMRAEGATVEIAGEPTRRLQESTSVEVVYDPPGPDSEPERQDVFGAAQEAWQRNGVTARSVVEYAALTTQERVVAPQ